MHRTTRIYVFKAKNETKFAKICKLCWTDPLAKHVSTIKIFIWSTPDICKYARSHSQNYHANTHQHILGLSFALYQINLINHNYSLRRTWCCSVRYILISSLICVRTCIIPFTLYTYSILSNDVFEIFISVRDCHFDCILLHSFEYYHCNDCQISIHVIRHSIWLSDKARFIYISDWFEYI